MNQFQKALILVALLAFIILAVVRFNAIDAALVVLGVYLLMPLLPNGDKR